MGRTFRPEEEQFGNSHVAILGYGLGDHRFNADPSELRKTNNAGTEKPTPSSASCPKISTLRSHGPRESCGFPLRHRRTQRPSQRLAECSGPPEARRDSRLKPSKQWIPSPRAWKSSIPPAAPTADRGGGNRARSSLWNNHARRRRLRRPGNNGLAAGRGAIGVGGADEAVIEGAAGAGGSSNRRRRC